MMKQILAASLAGVRRWRSPSRLRAEIIEQVLVKVNGDIITKTELEQRQIAALRARMRPDVDPRRSTNDDELKKALAEVTPQLLVDAVDELLLVQRGKELGYHAQRRAVQERGSTTSARNRTSTTTRSSRRR